MILLEITEGDFEVIFKRVEAVEDAVVKSFFAQFVPDMLHRIEFGGVWRQAQQSHVGRWPKISAGMPACSVEHHHDVLVWVALPYLVEKQLHAVRVDVGQDQRVEFATDHIHGGIGVGVLVGQHGLAQRTYRLGRPAATHVVDAPESRFVLEHQLDRALPGPERAEFGDLLGEFFFHSC